MGLFSFAPKPSGISLFNQKSHSDLFDILINKGFIKQEQIKQIEEDAARLHLRKEEVIAQKGLVSDENLALVYSLLFEIPVIHLPVEPISPDTLKLVSKEAAIALKVLPFGEKKGFPNFGIVNPFLIVENKSLLIEILKKNKITPHFYIITLSDFRRHVTDYEKNAYLAVQSQEFKSIDLRPEHLAYNVVAKIPREIAEKYQIIVFGYVPGQLIKIAVVDPTGSNVDVILKTIAQRSGLKIEKYLISEEVFQKAIKVYEQPPVPVKAEKTVITPDTEEMANVVQEEISNQLSKDIQNRQELENVVKTGHVPKVVAATINFALVQRATDIHVQPYEKKILLRFRIDGMLHDIVEVPKTLLPAIVSRIKILSKMKIDEQRIPQDGRSQVTTPDGREMDLRISTLPTVNGEKVVMRLQDQSRKIPDLPELGIDGSALKCIEESLAMPNGIILTTGPTGSGKTTTLYSALSRVNSPEVNILTIEDPVEIQMDGLNQSQVHPDIDYTFAFGLRTALRQDPDIIMVGEIRDRETIDVAIEASLTGHLVLSTIHTNSAVETLTRIDNMGVPPFLMTSTINTIIAQRLVRKVCEHCRQEIQVQDSTMEIVKSALADLPANDDIDPALIKNPKFYEGKGCDQCDGVGYKGRVGLYEVLHMNNELRRLILKRASNLDIEAAAKKTAGMVTLEQAGVIKALQGMTTLEEVYRVARHEEQDTDSKTQDTENKTQDTENSEQVAPIQSAGATEEPATTPSS